MRAFQQTECCLISSRDLWSWPWLDLDPVVSGLGLSLDLCCLVHIPATNLLVLSLWFREN